jgi:uncharacterized protein YggE
MNLRPSAAAIAILMGSAAVSAQVTFVPDQTPRITVDGRGSLTERPDMAGVSFGVYGLNQDLHTAKSGVDAAIGRLLKVADALGVDKKDVTASSLYVGPHYTDDTSHTFLGYEVIRAVDITLRDLARLEELIDSAIRAGANRDFIISLKASGEGALRERATMLAVEDAKAQAARIAGAFGMKLGAVRTISPGSRSVSSFAATSVSRGVGTGTFLPSSITVAAEVSVTFMLVP